MFVTWAIVDQWGFQDYYISVRHMTTRVLVSGIKTQITSRCLRKEGPQKAEITGMFYRITSLKTKDEDTHEKKYIEEETGVQCVTEKHL